jgi:hypothetical protein
MRTKFSNLIPLVILLLFAVTACKKKDDGSLTFDHRIISMASYSGNQLEDQTTIEYSGNKISKVASSYYNNGTSSGNEVYNFTYPNATTIHATTSSAQGTQTTTGTVDVTLANNKPTETIIVSGSNKDKTTFTYNSDGTVNKTSSYYYTTTWILSSERTFTYTSGKLTQISEIEYSGTTTYENKYVFSYNGDELKDEIHSYKQTGGTWVESYKNVYTYTSGKISNIVEYYKSGTSWIVSSSQDFVYDSDGNLIKESSSTSRTEYTYQDGSGNFLLLIESLGGMGNDMYPSPHKKSQKLKSVLNIVP